MLQSSAAAFSFFLFFFFLLFLLSLAGLLCSDLQHSSALDDGQLLLTQEAREEKKYDWM